MSHFDGTIQKFYYEFTKNNMKLKFSAEENSTKSEFCRKLVPIRCEKTINDFP